MDPKIQLLMQILVLVEQAAPYVASEIAAFRAQGSKTPDQEFTDAGAIDEETISKADAILQKLLPAKSVDPVTTPTP